MIILFALLLSLPVAATARRLALSFDDGLGPRTQPRAAAWNGSAAAGAGGGTPNDRYLAWLERHPGDAAHWLRDAYLAHLKARAHDYDSLSRRLFGRSRTCAAASHKRHQCRLSAGCHRDVQA